MKFFGLAAAMLVSVLVACGPGVGGSSASGSGELDGQAATERALVSARLRLMAGNLTTGNGQDYNPGHGIRIFQGTRPDIALVQEFNYGSDSEADLRVFVDTAFGAQFSFVRGTGSIPNGIVSRYPIVESGNWDDGANGRDFSWARIDVPGPTDLWAVSAHLLTSGTGERNNQAKRLVKELQAKVPAGDFIVVGGDFNTGSRGEGCLQTMSAVVVTGAPYPVDSRNNGHTNAGRNRPYDWVVVSEGLAAYATPTVIGTQSFTNGFVADTRVLTPIAGLAPALASDSAGPQMQHMGVVRDFVLPTDGQPVPSVSVVSPNGGETVTAGETLTIRWVSQNVAKVDLAYVDGTGTIDIATGLDAVAGSAQWAVPATTASSTGARIRVSSAGGSVADTSDGVFTVKAAPAPASVKLIAPNGGESFAAGSTQTIAWSSTSVAKVDLAFAADGVTFTRIATGLTASSGAVAWVVPTGATTAARIRVSDSPDAVVSDASDSPFVISAPVPLARVIVNEVLANEPGSDVDGEFIELANIGTMSVDVSGWSMSDSALVRHVFAPGTALGPGQRLVVYGKARAIPPGVAAVASSTGALGLSNSSDTVTVRDALSATVDAISYTSALAAVDGVSMNRSPDLAASAPLVLHTALSSGPSSPGTSP